MKKTVLPALCSIFIAAWAVTAQAQTFSWNGGGGDNNFSTGANWGGTGSTSPGTAPTPTTASALIFAGTTRLTPTIEPATAGYLVSAITFASGAGNFNVGASSASQYLEFLGASGTNVITDNQLIAANGTLAANLVTSNETISALIYLNAATMSVTGIGSSSTNLVTGSGNLTLSAIQFDSTTAKNAVITESSDALTLGTATWTGAVGATTLTINAPKNASGTSTLYSALQFTGTGYSGLATINDNAATLYFNSLTTNTSGFSSAATFNESSSNVNLSGTEPIALTGNFTTNNFSHRIFSFSDAAGVTIGAAGTTLNLGLSNPSGAATGTGADDFDVFAGSTATIAANLVDSVTGHVNAAPGGAGIVVNSGTSFAGNGGTLIMTGTNTYDGGTLVGTSSVGATLQVGNGGTTGQLGTGGVVLSNAASFLKYNRSDAALVDNNAISGAGAVSQIGTGTITLGGANSYTGTTTVSAGALSITGSNSSTANATTVTNATLEGTGTLAGTVMIGNGTGTSGSGTAKIAPGTLATGANIGTLTAGATTINQEGMLTLSINSSLHTTDLLVVNGNLNIATGAQLLVGDLGNGGAGSNVYDIVNYTGTLTGTFANAANNSNLTINGNMYELQYGATANEITLTEITAVPELSSGLSCVLGLGCFVLWQTLASRRKSALVC